MINPYLKLAQADDEAAHRQASLADRWAFGARLVDHKYPVFNAFAKDRNGFVMKP